MNILFVWCGAVGSVMIETLQALGQSEQFPLSITILARSDKFKSELNKDIAYKEIIMDNVLDFFTQESDLSLDRVINTALPQFNETIMQRALWAKVNYMDLASDIDETHVKNKSFPQSALAEKFQENNLCALLNCGISPWITEFCISYITRTYSIDPDTITLYLDENFNSLVPLFSRSPSVAITELLTPAVYIENKQYHTAQPFDNVTVCSSNKKRMHYIRITQEELISIQLMYPNMRSLSILAWWSEIEQGRLLYNLGLLTDPEIKSKLLKKLPGAASKEDISHAFDNNLIDDAWFCFSMEIKDTQQSKHIQVSFWFDDFKIIQKGRYKGSTSISYPTGLSAAWILFLWQSHKISGVHDCLSFSHELPLSALEDTRTFLKNNHITMTHT